MLKILHIITRLDMGGSAQNTLLTCRELAGKYRTVLVHGLARESGLTAAEEAEIAAAKTDAVCRGVKLIPVAPLVRRIRPLADLRALLALIWHLWVERPDIVHTHTSKAGILGRLAARLVGIPHVVHTPHGHVFHGHFGRLTAGVFLAIERFFSAFTDKLVAISAGERGDYVGLKVAAAGDVVTIHSGVDVDSFSAGSRDPVAKKRSLGLDPRRPLVGFVGWLLPIKGPMHLLNAMARVWGKHPDAVLVMVGKGELEAKLRQRVAAMNADDRVKFLGWREDVREVMPLFDVFVLPSLNEGMGRVLVEAMAAGVPVVASRTGGIPDLVRDGETGILVAPMDEAGLAEGLSRLLADSAQARRMGARGRLRCREFSLASMVEKLDTLYLDLAGARAPGATHASDERAPRQASRQPRAPEGEKCLPFG